MHAVDCNKIQQSQAYKFGLLFGSKSTCFGQFQPLAQFERNDFWIDPFTTWAWMLRETKGSIPAPRQNPAIGILGTKLYIHGGRGSLMLDDLHVLDTVSFTWNRVSEKGVGPSPRYIHSAWVYEKKYIPTHF
eukprot:Gb_34561 [translate_table: standard]